MQHPGNAAAENRIRVYLGYCGPESKYMDILSLSIGVNHFGHKPYLEVRGTVKNYRRDARDGDTIFSKFERRRG